jgi:uncharacterized membrane protein
MRHLFTLSRTYAYMAALAFLGVVDALYLTVEHYRNVSVLCLTGSGCDAVLQSRYALIFGNFPLSGVGIIYYAAVFAITLYSVFRHHEFTRYLAARLPMIGLLASLWFVYLQLYIVRAICTWCMVSASLCVLLFVLGLRIMLHKPQSV